METRINAFEKGKKAMGALFTLSGYLKKATIERELLELVDFRVSQINGCAYCLDMHSKELRAMGETEQRLYSLSAWRECPYYTSRERAALAWAEAITKTEVTDEVYRTAKEAFSDEELVDLTLGITTINTWNRFNLAFANTPGSYQVGMFG
ncbi:MULTISPECIES: carboxymuconolactone decarboxylase family protein [Olivibacter]|uniref:Alkylhydroperoxidase like protein, AhpD family n=3 Tax=Sphingobacteriaceae TaxID=84566 RepID=F4C7P6_SPHS2|nr:carboxymuconolactone decarboxylase family protein [Olivibacter sp. LS-1]MDX3914764.1 carboxymuconolactone decarboxylase family protein [Pseudosphingobacterium sp.]QEL03386.1 carboxymuconolactone decarboxylase family protein [Olivibacter sp. LS-1]